MPDEQIAETETTQPTETAAATTEETAPVKVISACGGF